MGDRRGENLKHRASPRIGVLLAVVACFGTFAFIALAWDSIVEEGVMARIDSRWQSTFVSNRVSWVTTMLRAVAWLGDIRVLSALIGSAAIVFVLARTPIYAPVVAVTTWGAAALAAILKAALARPRPPAPGHVVAVAGSAFPSAHAAQAVAFYGVLAWIAAHHLHRRTRRVLVWSASILCAGAVGVSRVYLGVHWPSDVVSGWLIGAGWLIACLAGVRAVSDHLLGQWALPKATAAQPP